MSDWVEVDVEGEKIVHDGGIVRRLEGKMARKWFGDHYKEVHVAPDGDLDAATAQVDAFAASQVSAAPVAATPAAEAKAEEHGVDLSEVDGTGKDGRVIVADVAAVVEPAPAPADNAA